MKTKEMYNKIFLETEAKVVIPALRYVFELMDIRDALTEFDDVISKWDYPYVGAVQMKPALMIDFIKKTRTASNAELESAFDMFREVLWTALESTIQLQMKLLESPIDLDSYEMSKVIRCICWKKNYKEGELSDEELLEVIVDSIASVKHWLCHYEDCGEEVEEDLCRLDDLIEPDEKIDEYLESLLSDLEEDDVKIYEPKSKAGIKGKSEAKANTESR